MPDALLLTVLAVIGVGLAATRLLSRPVASVKPNVAPGVGIGTVRQITDVITMEVESVTGVRFTGRLHDDSVAGVLRPGAVLMVAFDPAAREHLSLADDMLAVRAVFDQMLVDKGLLTCRQLDLIRHGTRSHGVVTGMQATGETREDYREVELDVMVSRPGGGQFAAHETALIPASSMAKVSPGSVIDTYYRPGDETEIAVSVPPS
ncbi:hypothetical protein [Mycolicibacterium stellerae]|uniref:hypothetical protein n=1 Tax=Mycolicibacterium stellerae TaxID=2358193 RepID=UPI000F0BB403|nr:hypothetical protein [Mycolicibacterium stellerae]